MRSAWGVLPSVQLLFQYALVYLNLKTVMVPLWSFDALDVYHSHLPYVWTFIA